MQEMRAKTTNESQQQVPYAAVSGSVNHTTDSRATTTATTTTMTTTTTTTTATTTTTDAVADAGGGCTGNGSLMCAPILNADGNVLAVCLLSNKSATTADEDASTFSDNDEKVKGAFSPPIVQKQLRNKTLK